MYEVLYTCYIHCCSKPRIPSLLFAAVLRVLVSIAIASVSMETRQKDYEDEAPEGGRNGAHAVDEVNVGAENNEQAVAGQDVEPVPTAQLRRRKLGRGLVRKIPKMGRGLVRRIPEMGRALNFSHRRSGSEGSSGGIEEIPSAMAMEPSLPHEGENSLGALSRTSSESNGESILRAPPLRNGATGDSEAHEVGSNGRTKGRQNGLESLVEEEMKGSLKFSYFSTSIASAGILGLLSGFISDNKEQIDLFHLKICTSLILAVIVSGASMILLTPLCSWSHACIRIIKYLKYANLGLLTLATFNASILFLESYALLAFVPTVVVVMVAFIVEHFSKSSIK